MKINKSMFIKVICYTACTSFGVWLGYYYANKKNRMAKKYPCKADLIIDYDPVYGSDMYISIDDNLESIMKEDYIYCKVIRKVNKNVEKEQNESRKA